MKNTFFARYALMFLFWAGMSALPLLAQIKLRKIDVNPPPPSPITVWSPLFSVDYMADNNFLPWRTMRGMMHRDNALAAQRFEEGLTYRKKAILFNLAGWGLIGAGISQGFHKEGTELSQNKKSAVVTGVTLGAGALIGGMILGFKRTQSFREAVELYNLGLGVPVVPPARPMFEWYWGAAPNGGVGLTARF